MTADERIDQAKAAAMTDRDLLLRWMKGESDLWKWVQGELTKAQRELSKLVGDARLAPESRSVIAGKLALVVELLEKPANLLTIYESTERQAMAIDKVTTLRRVPPRATPTVA